METTVKEPAVSEKETAELEKAASNGHDEQSASFTKTESARQPARVD